jgi:hypothetical protein
MTALIALLGPKVIGSLVAAVALIVGLLGYGMKKKREGAREAKAEQASAEAKARDISNEIQNDVGALPGSEARKELGKWAR